MESDNKKPDIMSQIMRDFEQTRKQLKQTIENLSKTHANLQQTKTNFDNYNNIKKNDVVKHVTYFGIQSLEEKTKQLENEFVTCSIENNGLEEQIIIIDEITKKN